MLEIPDFLGPSTAEHQQIETQWSTFGKVQDALAKEGFTPLPQPVYACPGYLDPNILNSHDSRVLTIEFARYKAWRDFTANRLMYSKQILLETKTQLQKVEALCKKHLMSHPDNPIKKPTREDILQLAQQSLHYTDLEQRAQEHQQLEIAYETRLSEFSSSMQLISRSVTMRGQDIQQGLRGNNLGSGNQHEQAGTPRPFF